MLRLRGPDIKVSHFKFVLYAFFLATIFSLFLFGRTVSFDLIYLDDFYYLTKREWLYVKDSLWNSLTSVWTTFPREEPLLMRDTVWALIVNFAGMQNTAMLHLVQTLFHTLNTFLLFYWLYLLTENVRFAALTTLLHFSFPFCAETVAWIMEFKGVLSTTWMLATFVCFSLYLKQSHQTRWLWYGLSIVTTACALMSKQNTLVIPGFLILLAAVQAGFLTTSGVQLAQGNKATLFKYSLLVLPHAIISIFLTLWFLKQSESSLALAAHQDTSFIAFLPQLLVFTPLVILQYPYIAFVRPEYHFYLDWPLNDTPITTPLVLIAVSFYAFIALACYWSWRRNGFVLFWIFAFAMFLFPYMEWVRDLVWISNRYLYVTGIAMAALVAFTLERALNQPKPAFKWICILVFTSMLGYNLWRTQNTVPIFEDARTFWENEKQFTPHRARVYLGLSSAYITRQQNLLIPPANRMATSKKLDDLLNEAIEKLNLQAPPNKTEPEGRAKGLLLQYRATTPTNPELTVDDKEQLFLQSIAYYPRHPDTWRYYGDLLLKKALDAETESEKFEGALPAFEKHLISVSVPGQDALPGDKSALIQQVYKFYDRTLPGFTNWYAERNRQQSQQNKPQSQTQE